MRSWILSEDNLRQWAGNYTADQLKLALQSLAHKQGEVEFRKVIAQELVTLLRPEEILPNQYGRYTTLVKDGIEFFLANVSTERLIDLMTQQIFIEGGCSRQFRLYELARFFPSLHKLAQIIARNRYLAPEIQQWFIQLESGHYGQPAETIVEHIKRLIPDTLPVCFAETILAEASVGAVIRFEAETGDASGKIYGVFKTLKPGIEQHLKEELAILGKMSNYFDKNSHRYPFRKLRFTDFFQDIAEHLAKEIDLGAEQNSLLLAADFWAGLPGVHIPKLLPLSYEHLIALEYIDGFKVTDAPLGNAARKQCAALLFEALICRPLFAPSEPAIYHGDPHSGNILATVDKEKNTFCLHLIDWSLAGKLGKRERALIVDLIQGILSDDLGHICTAVKGLADIASQGQHPSCKELRDCIASLMNSEEFKKRSMVRKSFLLLEELSYEGLVFPADLVLFRKAFFTLEGVLHELDPGFAMDTFMMVHLTSLIGSETGQRYRNLLIPGIDVPENYRSLMSNGDLCHLMFRQQLKFVSEYNRVTTNLLTRQAESLTRFFTDWLT